MKLLKSEIPFGAYTEIWGRRLYLHTWAQAEIQAAGEKLEDGISSHETREGP